MYSFITDGVFLNWNKIEFELIRRQEIKEQFKLFLRQNDCYMIVFRVNFGYFKALIRHAIFTSVFVLKIFCDNLLI